MALKIHVRKCPECKDEFTVSGHAAGRKRHCSPECAALSQRAAERRYRENHFDPWQWENTILEWNE